jgi:hypothetical protein
VQRGIIVTCGARFVLSHDSTNLATHFFFHLKGSQKKSAAGPVLVSKEACLCRRCRQGHNTKTRGEIKTTPERGTEQENTGIHKAAPQRINPITLSVWMCACRVCKPSCQSTRFRVSGLEGPSHPSYCPAHPYRPSVIYLIVNKLFSLSLSRSPRLYSRVQIT